MNKISVGLGLAVALIAATAVAKEVGADNEDKRWSEMWCEVKLEEGQVSDWFPGGKLKKGTHGMWLNVNWAPERYKPAPDALRARAVSALDFILRAKRLKYVAGSIQCDQDSRKVYP